MEKRSITIAKHKTSISLEREYWDMIDHISLEKKVSLSGMIELIDRQKTGTNLASEIRIYVLNYLLELSKKSLV
ncbi:MAG: ribbon-helix-helix domain-containing protein [Hyphomicrobiales bacterium]|jgi:predicted DNA-binding ribbon-helix-helix protein|nr:ribbon-helix-helix domain-containing protein [Hyphomicrobiales bacterium]|tara:strand:+ start:2439 stop:2660 length:222 start_codon:yes stop_codon:yes gene_type:complete